MKTEQNQHVFYVAEDVNLEWDFVNVNYFGYSSRNSHKIRRVYRVHQRKQIQQLKKQKS